MTTPSNHQAVFFWDAVGHMSLFNLQLHCLFRTGFAIISRIQWNIYDVSINYLNMDVAQPKILGILLLEGKPTVSQPCSTVCGMFQKHARNNSASVSIKRSTCEPTVHEATNDSRYPGGPLNL